MTNSQRWSFFFAFRPGFADKLDSLAARMKFYPETIQDIATHQIEEVKRKYAVE